MVKTTAPTANGSVHKNGTEVLKVFVTSDYSIFKIMKDNRAIHEQHVMRLVESFKDNHLICPIIVNEKYEVIDGQHRLEASRITGKPVHYMVVPGYGIHEVKVLNANQKNWTKLDFLKAFAEQGKPAYVALQKFMDDFPDYGIQSAERLVSLRSSGSRTKEKFGIKMEFKDFEEGKLKVPNIDQSYIYARKISEFKPYYKGYHRGAFVSAIMPLLSMPKVYNHKEMIHKLDSSKLKIEDQTTVEMYRQALEDIYNYRRGKESKVSFKYV